MPPEQAGVRVGPHTSLLDVQGLHAGYATAGILRGIELSVADGQAVALLGRNGMGKTSLLRAICGLRPPAVSDGTVRFAGREIAAWPPYLVARLGIGLVPQGRRVFRSLSVEENLKVAARGPRPGSDKSVSPWTLASVIDLFPRLGERKRQLAATLSGGEQQMLAIGRALMTNPRLLVMDEPSEGLAPAVLDTILDRLLQLRAAGQAVLIAEQNVDLALELADRVDILGDGGLIAWSGAPEKLRADTRILHELVGV